MLPTLCGPVPVLTPRRRGYSWPGLPHFPNTHHAGIVALPCICFGLYLFPHDHHPSRSSVCSYSSLPGLPRLQSNDALVPISIPSFGSSSHLSSQPTLPTCGMHCPAPALPSVLPLPCNGIAALLNGRDSPHSPGPTCSSSPDRRNLLPQCFSSILFIFS